MNLKAYSEIIGNTAVYPKEIGKLYCALGLCGESGEVAEKIKKLYRDQNGEYNQEFVDSLTKELGDCIWYITALAHEFGIELDTIVEKNFHKLMNRRATGTLHGSGDNREDGVIG